MNGKEKEANEGHRKRGHIDLQPSTSSYCKVFPYNANSFGLDIRSFFEPLIASQRTFQVKWLFIARLRRCAFLNVVFLIFRTLPTLRSR